MAKIEDFYPLSPMQEGLLFESLLASEQGAYITQHSYVLENLDVARFRQAWQRVLDRHSILRTAFVWKRSCKPLQAVIRDVPVPFEEDDWRSLSAEQQDRKVEEYMLADRRRGFNFNRAPLMRVAVMRLSNDRYRVFLSHHHMLLDGWSLPLLFGEVAQIYSSLCEGRNIGLPSVRPFKDYIEWLRLQSPQEAEAYWRHAIKGIKNPTPIGVKASIQPQETSLRYRDIFLTEENTARLRSWVGDHGFTLSTVITGIWALALARIAASSEVVFGMVVSGRPADLPGVEAMLGIFINTLPVFIEVPAEGKVNSWFAKIQTLHAEMRQYQHASLADIRKWSELPSGKVLFDSIVDFLNYPAQAAQEGGHAIQAQDASYSNSNSYPLQFVIEARNQLLLRVTYDAARVEEKLASRLLSLPKAGLESLFIEGVSCLEDLRKVIEAADRELERQGRILAHSAARQRLAKFHATAAQVKAAIPGLETQAPDIFSGKAGN